MTPPQLTDYVEAMESLAARTQKLCSDQPGQARVRTALLTAEKAVHTESGWDSPPVVFFLSRRTSGLIKFTKLNSYSRLLVDLPGRTAQVLDMLANVAEFIRHQAQLPDDELNETVRGLSPEEAVYFERMRAHSTQDLLRVGREATFHGIGLIAECWGAFLSDADPATRESLGAAAAEHRLYQHPGRVEMRQVFYAARDGWLWEVARLRRTADIAVPRFCVARTHDSDYEAVGTVPNAITRLCNAIASNPVPIIPADTPDDIGAALGRPQ